MSTNSIIAAMMVIRGCAEEQSRTAIPSFSDSCRDHLGYLGSERAKGIEPSVLSLARRCFTGKLRPREQNYNRLCVYYDRIIVYER